MKRKKNRKRLSDCLLLRETKKIFSNDICFLIGFDFLYFISSNITSLFHFNCCLFIYFLKNKIKTLLVIVFSNKKKLIKQETKFSISEMEELTIIMEKREKYFLLNKEGKTILPLTDQTQRWFCFVQWGNIETRRNHK
jgi:hypothetical protein